MSESTFDTGLTDSVQADNVQVSSRGDVSVTDVAKTDAAPLDLSGFIVGEKTPFDVYVVHGYYVDVPDLDGSMVNIERVYDQSRYASEIGPNERGNLLLASGDILTDEIAALLEGPGPRSGPVHRVQ